MRSKKSLWSVYVICAVIAAMLLLGMRQDEIEFPSGSAYGSHMDSRMHHHIIRDSGILMGSELSTVCERQINSHTQRTAAVLLTAALILLSRMIFCIGRLQLRVFVFSPLRYLFDLSVLQRKDGKKRTVSFFDITMIERQVDNK